MWVALLASATPARAQSVRDRARSAYDRGLDAHKKGQFAVAAREFALADELQPSPVALRAAVDAAIEADDPVLGMTLVARSKRGASTPELTPSLEKARARFSKRTGRVLVVCNDGAPCEGTVDGNALPAGSERYVVVGEHAVRFRVAGAEEARSVKVIAEEVVELRPSAALGLPGVAPAPTPTAPAATPPPVPLPPGPAASPAPASAPAAPAPVAEPSRKPLPPAVLFVGIGLTAIAGGIAIGSAVDVQGKHDDFADQRCATLGSTACQSLASDGESAQTRTNVLLAVTGGLAVVTTVLAITLVDFGGGGKGATTARVDMGPLLGPGLSGIRLGGAF